MSQFIDCPINATPSLVSAILHSSIIGIFYVLSLYAFVPAKLRALPRYSSLQINARMKAIGFTTLFILFIYFPLTFCQSGSDTPSSPPRTFLTYLSLPSMALETISAAGLSLRLPVLFPPKPLLHNFVLFLGPLVTLFFEIKALVDASHHQSKHGWKWKSAAYQILVVENFFPETWNVFSWESERIRG
jgi:hypothetical protein